MPPVSSGGGCSRLSRRSAKGATLAYLPALDGIRGVAMLGILGVHAGVYLTAGGFFLLDSFFALSGFLDHLAPDRRNGARAGPSSGGVLGPPRRRLLPGALRHAARRGYPVRHLRPGRDLPDARGDALSALFYFANWHFIVSGSDYFHMTGLTSPLIHTWSLAVEEQFYLVWPLVFLGVMKLTRSLRCAARSSPSPGRWPRRWRWRSSTTRPTSTASTSAPTPMPSPCWSGPPSPSVWPSGRTGTARGTNRTGKPHAVGRRVLTAIGVVGLVVAASSAPLCTQTMPSYTEGGSFLAAIAWAGVLLQRLVRSDLLRRPGAVFLLFTFVGRISYGMYLWHFPLFTFINEQRTGLKWLVLYAVRVIPTVGVALLSFYLVERPIRQGTFFTFVPGRGFSRLPP